MITEDGRKNKYQLLHYILSRKKVISVISRYIENANFEDTADYAWLQAHCADYGFILRYPEGKQPITGYRFEPWHYRYVGVEAAAEIMDQGLCLEEYLAANYALD